MNKIIELEKLIKEDILLEVNENLQELNKNIENKKQLKEEIKYMVDVEKYFKTLLDDIQNNNLQEKEASDILSDLEYMKTQNQED